MLLSMTGFGAAHGQVDGVEFDVEVRSVNSRYFKCSLKVPECHSQTEADIEKCIRRRVGRGAVSLSVRMRMPDDQAAHDVNVAALNRYVSQLRAADAVGGQGMRVDLASILLLPGVCDPPAMSDLRDRTAAGLIDLAEKAIEGLVAMRREEGKAVEADLRDHCRTIEAGVTTVTAAAPRVLQLYHERLMVRVQELMGDGRLGIEDQTLVREVAVFAERSDIAEEVSRLTGHVAQFHQALDADGPIGRKLDFIAQEMLREANTIASKAGDVGIAREVVDIKTAIDRIKEQVQNVE